jgi:tRNA A-37 threonylcarbamoyl transferase component Bud32
MVRRAPHPVPPSAGEPPAVFSDLGGHRPLRVLGRGSRCTVSLAASGDVVLKTFASDASADSIAAEAACLSAVRSPHVVELRDVTAGIGRPTCLVLERVDGPLLDEVLRRRGLLDTGEIVTLAVSLLRGVVAVHDAGWTHGALSTSRVRLDASGRPVLLGFGHAAPAEPVSLREERRRAADLLDTLLDHAESELDHLDGASRCDAVRSTLKGYADARDPAADAHAVERALFALGPAAPVLTTSATDEGGGHRRDEAVRMARSTGEDDALRTGSGRGRRAPRRAGRLSRLVLDALERGPSALVREAVRRLPLRRRPLLVAAAIAVAVTGTALVLVPTDPGAERADAATTGRPTGTATAAPTPTVAPTPSPVPTVAAVDDPVHAAVELLVRRRSCLLTGQASCLEAVEEPGGPLHRADVAALAAGEHGTRPPDPERLSLSESLGDVAIVAVAPNGSETEPASLLVVRSEAGWRLRDYYED